MVPVAIVWLAFALLAKDAPGSRKPKPWSDYLSVLRIADTGWFCFIYSLTFGGFVGLASFLTIFFLSAISICLAGVGMLPSVGLALGLLIFAMGMLGMGNGAVFQLVPQRFPDRVGLLTGIVCAAGGFGGFMLPNILGTLKDKTGSYGTGFFVCAVLVMAGAAALLHLRSVWTTNWSEASALRAGLLKRPVVVVAEEQAA